MTEDLYKLTGKGKKARHRLNAVDKEIGKIKEQLDKARDALMGIIVRQAFSKIEGVNEDESKEIWEELKINLIIDSNDKILKKFSSNKKNSILNDESKYKNYEVDIIKILGSFKKQEKLRCMVADVPKRIEAEFNCLKFYIDFTLVASERDGQNNIKGSIIYGTNRTLCFAGCTSGKKDKCQRTARCDGLEDKPLISFEVTPHGMIQSSGKLEGEWWIENISDLDELHYRTLDLIWNEALDWANEIILP